MVTVGTVAELKEVRKSCTGTVGFVPTMGALHNGHLSLIRRARTECDCVIVSIFVNPTQFLEGEDLDAYPRKEAADSKICGLAGTDILFIPTIDQMYGRDELRIEAPKLRGYTLEGAKRPGHFDGMLQIVMKLLNLTRATRAYFGKKDAQQLALITQMAQDYFIDVEIVPCDIVRDSNGLALSSRNAYLSEEQKQQALAISRALRAGTEMIVSGERDSAVIMSQMRHRLDKGVDRIDYVAIVDRAFSEQEQVVIGDTILLVAAYVGEVRLIDNLWI